MKCINCGSEATYNRAVVDTGAGEFVGGFCSGCEERVGRETLRSGTDSDDEQCQKCERLGRYALPEHHIEISLIEGEERVSEGYEVVAETPVFCERHAPIVTVEPLGTASSSEPVTGESPQG